MSEQPVSPPSIGVIIKSDTIRGILYGAYGIVALAIGGIAVYFVSIGHPLPTFLVGAQGVIAYLAIPFSGLAVANAVNKAAVAAPPAVVGPPPVE